MIRPDRHLPLPEFETTLVKMVLELLRAPAKYPQLVLSQPIDAQGEAAPDAVRITHHYVTALQAFGYQLNDYELQQALKWFAVPFPREQVNTIDMTEMNRLEALLMLCPPRAEFVAPELTEHIHPRLDALVRQRGSGDEDLGGSFIINGDNPLFDNLWALKVLCMAHDRRVLRPALMDSNQLNQWLDVLVHEHYKDKDLALALRICYEQAGMKIRRGHKKHLDRLMRFGRKNLGMWDLRNNLQWLVNHMHTQELHIGDVAEHRDAFRDMIVSTCYVIENLMPLTRAQPQLMGAIQEAMDLWWNVIYGERVVDKLMDLFPEPYDYLLILSRTVVAVCTYVGAYEDKPLSERLMPHVYRTLSAQQTTHTGTREQENILLALRDWMPLDMIGEPDELKLGMSGANVVRIRPRLRNPLNPEFPLQFVDSLIVKYGPVEEIDLERRNYARLPQALLDCFVAIPQESHIDQTEGRAYVIMADLANHQTLYERLPTLHTIRDPIIAELPPFLMKMHRGGEAQSPSDHQSLLWEVYLLPMQEYAGRSFRLLREHPLLEQPLQEDAYVLQDRLNELMGKLVQRQLRLGEFPTAYMHGDLHSRNIMLRPISQWETNGGGHRLDFKLIDLEKFESAGDAALDAGQILIDLQLAQRKMSDTDFSHRVIGELMQQLADYYEDFGEERGDYSFPARVQLAKARSLLRIAKGRTKYAESKLKESRKAPAIGTAREVLAYAGQAVDHLEKMLAAIEGDSVSLMA